MFPCLLVFLLSFAVAITAVPTPSAAPDVFVLKDGILQQKQFSAALNETWYSATSEYVLKVLANDVIKNDPLESCVLEDLSDVQRNKSASVVFRDIAKVRFVFCFLMVRDTFLNQVVKIYPIQNDFPVMICSANRYGKYGRYKPEIFG